jgi:hypothetical protein
MLGSVSRVVVVPAMSCHLAGFFSGGRMRWKRNEAPHGGVLIDLETDIGVRCFAVLGRDGWTVVVGKITTKLRPVWSEDQIREYLRESLRQRLIEAAALLGPHGITQGGEHEGESQNDGPTAKPADIQPGAGRSG